MTAMLPTPVAGSNAEARGARNELLRRMLTNPAGLTAVIVLGILCLAAIFAPLITSADPTLASLQNLLLPPSATHPLGTDAAGRDVFARILYGSRFSLLGALLGAGVAAAIGVTSGLIAGYFRGFFESLSGWLVSILMALPAIIVLLAARAVVGPSLWLAMAVFGVLLAPAFYRLVYAAVVGVRDELFVDAARVSGVGDNSIIGRHILFVVRAPIIIQAATVMSIAIAIQAGLDFLGLGDPSIPTWGNMLNDAFAKMYQAPLLLIWPSTAIAITSIMLALFANALRDELERSNGKTPRRRKNAAVPVEQPVASELIIHDQNHSDSGPVLLSVDSLVVGYDQPDGTVTTVVDGVSLVLRKGEVHGLIGESGSGKTQTAWSILHLLPTGGRIRSGVIHFDGMNLAEMDDAAVRKLRGKRIAYIPQEPMSNLDPSFTVGSQLVEPLRAVLGLSKKEATVRALELLSLVGIPNPERTFAAYPHEISGGMAQRVLIAGAISCSPDLIIADEPTTALDVTVQAEILDLLRRLQRDLGLSVLIVTHNFGVVADLCDQVSVMQNGKIVETGPVRSIFSNPRHPYTRSLFEAILEEGLARSPFVLSTDNNVNPGGAR